MAKSDYLKLAPILALAFFMAFIPRLDYPYPVHIDEWVHMAYIQGILDSNSVTFVDPFLGNSILGLSTNLETGFDLFWSVFHDISGISLIAIFRYLPSVMFMLTSLSVYIVGRREGFGWEAALFSCLVPTTVGIMGPAFLVPVAMGMLFAPLSLFIALNFKSGWSCLVLFVFTVFLIAIHAPSAIFMVIILVPVILLNLKGNLKHSLGIILAVAVPFLLTLPFTYQLITVTARSLLTQQPLPPYHDFPQIIREFGIVPILLCLLGTFLVAFSGGRRNYSFVLGLLIMVLMLAVFYTLHYGVPLLYLRGLLFTMLMMSIVAGAGLMRLRKLELPGMGSIGLNNPVIIKTAGTVLCLVLIGVTLVIGIRQHLNTPYYYMIDREDYEAFVWIRDNVGEAYERAILNPWKATAFTAITGKSIHTRIHINPSSKDDKARAFLNSGCTGTDFLTENAISIVYNTEPCSNSDLVQVRKNVYLLK